MNDEEILKDKKEFCKFLRTIADDLENTKDVILLCVKMQAFFQTLQASTWYEIIQKIELFMKGKIK
jgi:hypothetical protein